MHACSQLRRNIGWRGNVFLTHYVSVCNVNVYMHKNRLLNIGVFSMVDIFFIKYSMYIFLIHSLVSL
jgi:hypothetical protein